MKKLSIITVVLAFAITAFANNSGELKGRIKDWNGKKMAGVRIDILDASGKTTERATLTDPDGNYTIGELNAGNYDVQYSYRGYAVKIVKDVLISSDHGTSVNINLKPSATKEIEVVEYVAPILNDQDTKIEQRSTQAEIKNQNVNDVAGQKAGVEQKDAGSGITIDGSREDEVQYQINGIPLMNNMGSKTDARPR